MSLSATSIHLCVSRDGDSTSLRQPVPMLDDPLHGENCPNTQSKPSLVQPKAISSCPIAYCLGEETDPLLANTSFHIVPETQKVSPQTPFLQSKQPKLPEPLLVWLQLRSLHLQSWNHIIVEAGRDVWRSPCSAWSLADRPKVWSSYCLWQYESEVNILC